MFHEQCANNFCMDKKLTRFLKKQYYGGKSLVARIFDGVLEGVLLFLFLFAALWLLRLGLLRAAIAAAVLCACMGIAALLVHRWRYERFLERKIREAQESLMLERLILMDGHARHALIRELFEAHTGQTRLHEARGGWLADGRLCCYLPNHPQNPVSVQQLSAVYRMLKQQQARGCTLLTAAGYTQDAQTMARRQFVNTELLGRAELCALLAQAGHMPARQEALHALRAEMDQQKITAAQLKQAFLEQGKGRAFLLCAVLLGLWPLLGGFHIAFPLAAAACGSIALISFLRNKKHSRA